MKEAVAPAQTLGFPDQKQRCPREGIAAALVIEKDGREHIESVIVVDFYREAAQS